MFNIFKRKTSVVKFTPCVGIEEISDFVVRDLLLDINENNNISIGFCGDMCLGAIVNKFAYNLEKQKINYQSIKFFNLIEFIAPKIENKYLPFSFFMQKEFYSKLRIHEGQVYSLNPKNNNELDE
jgi:6-phosphogluconolactonase/glucosamine-6-phosphate isomerase/deaminase